MPNPFAFSSSRRRLAASGLVLAAFAVYALLFLPLAGWLGATAAVFAVLPVALAGALLGESAALVAGLVALPLQLTLSPLAGFSWRGALVSALAVAVIGALIGRMRDVGRKLRLEHAQLRRTVAREKRATAALEVRNAVLALAQEVSGIGDWEWLPRTGAFNGSAGLFRLLGVPVGRRPASFEAFLDSVHPEDRAAVKDRADRALNERCPFDAELRFRQAGGEDRVVQMRGTVLTGPSGEVDKVIGTAQDVTEQKKSHARTLLMDRTASLATFASGAAHEINNPLAYVVANLELISFELRETTEGPQREFANRLFGPIDEARQGAERIRRIVQDLKTFSRGNEDILGPVDLVPVLELAAKMSFNEFRQRARLVRCFGEVPPVKANPSRLAQLVVNLLVNAAQALPEGGAQDNEIRLVTRTDAQGRVVIEVGDTGPGMPPEIRERIFDPFFTTKPIGVGTGLGLSICHGIVTSFGGEITVESDPGKGTTFRIVLQPARDAATPRALPGTGTAEAPAEVLIVDDDPLAASGLKRLLASEHRVEIVTDGKQALERLLCKRFDVVLCDLMMPNLTGMDLYEEVARQAPEQAQRMLFVTGGAFTAQAKAFVAQRFDRVLEKPMDPRRLRAVIRERAVRVRMEPKRCDA